MTSGDTLRPLRIALVHPYPWPEVRRGAERYLDDLSRYLAGCGHHVIVITGPRGNAVPGAPASPDGAFGSPHAVVCRHLRLRGGWRLGITEVETFGAAVFTPLCRLRPDVVHAFTPSGALAGRLAGLPTLYTVLGHPARSQLPPQRLPRALLVAAIRAASTTATLSQASARALRTSLARPSVVLPPGICLDRFPPELRARTGPPRLLFSASLADDRKRVELAVGALALVRARHPGARLVLSGEGDPGRALHIARALGPDVAGAIEVAGPGRPEEVPGRYRRASVTVLPAKHEAFGLALVESLASGTPVVCTPDGGMAEIPDRRTGRVAQAGTAGAVARAVEEALSLAAQADTPARCVERARRFDWAGVIGPAHQRLYRQLAGGRRDPAAPPGDAALAPSGPLVKEPSRR